MCGTCSGEGEAIDRRALLLNYARWVRNLISYACIHTCLVGSEMCIRDSWGAVCVSRTGKLSNVPNWVSDWFRGILQQYWTGSCKSYSRCNTSVTVLSALSTCCHRPPNLEQPGKKVATHVKREKSNFHSLQLSLSLSHTHTHTHSQQQHYSSYIFIHTGMN